MEEGLIPKTPVILRALDKYQEAPLVGLEYLVEIIHGPNVDPTYECLLCMSSFNVREVMEDLLSAKHRLRYLVSDP